MIKDLHSMVNAEQDLRITRHISLEDFPKMIQSILSLAQSDAEKDMLLLSGLTAAGSCMSKVYCRYGLNGKRYYPNLQCFIVGSAACGKGIANLALELVSKVDAALPLIIPGDSSYPGFYRRLEQQKGCGYIHESEGSVITDVWRSSVANYNTALRKAAEHESITRNRIHSNSSIECPRLSVLLTGTFNQYKTLVPSIENGYFSRLLTLIIDEQQAFSSKYIEPTDERQSIMPIAAEQLFQLCKILFKSDSIEFSLTDEQRNRLGCHLETAYPALISLLGRNFHSVVLRMGVQIERIAMILTLLRMSDDIEKISVLPSKILCSDVDYDIAELIGNKLLLHMAAAYRMIKGEEQVSVPTIQTFDQRQLLLSLLPNEFETKMLLREAKAQGITERTAFRWNEEWLQTGIIQKIHHGMYKKTERLR